MKLEPLSIGEIKELVSSRDHLRLILAWAHERAEKNRQSWWRNYLSVGTDDLSRKAWANSVWVDEVLDSIGWPKEGR